MEVSAEICCDMFEDLLVFVEEVVHHIVLDDDRHGDSAVAYIASDVYDAVSCWNYSEAWA